MAQTGISVKNNQITLMNVLKKCMEDSANEATTSSPVTSVSSKASCYQVRNSNPLDREDQEPVPQMSMLIPNKRNKNKHVGKLKQQPSKQEIVRDVNIDNVGQAAEWLEKGTKEEDEFNDNDQVTAQDSITASIRLKMQDKADQIMKGSYRQPRVPTSQDLIQKAKLLRENNQRRVRPQHDRNESLTGASRASEQPAQQEKSIVNAIVPSEAMRQTRMEESVSSQIDLLPINRLQRRQPVEDQDDRWDQINQNTINEKKELLQTKKEYKREELEQYYLKRDVGQQRKLIEAELAEQKEAGFFGFFKACMGIAPKSNETVIRVQLLALSKVQISSDEDTYLLEGTWRLIKGSQPFNRYGLHWVDIGFQGRDPATDLRSTGVLSLLMMYMFGQRLPDYFRKVYSSSIDCHYEFPFAISLVKITGTYIKLLRKGKLQASSFEQYCEWFEAICYNIFQRLLKEKLVIIEFGMAITRLLEEAETSLKELMKAYRAAALS